MSSKDKFKIILDQEKKKNPLQFRKEFLENLDYFWEGLKEYENMKDTFYRIIDLGNNMKNRIYSEALLFWRRDLVEEQNKLVDKLIEENCVGAINCKCTKRFFVPSQWYLEAYFIKLKS